MRMAYDWENAIALGTMQGNRASSPREGKVSWDFSSCGRNLGYILELQLAARTCRHLTPSKGA